MLAELASGERRAAYLPVSPPDDLHAEWTVDPRHGLKRAAAPQASEQDGQLLVSGELAFVPDAPGADLLVGVALRDGKPVGRGHRGGRQGRHGRAPWSATTRPARSAHVSLADAPATVLEVSEESLAGGLVPVPGAARRGVARQRRDGARGERRLRQGALHLRPRDRLLPGDQARAHRGPAPARERALAALLRRLGAAAELPTSSRSRPARRGRWADEALDEASRTMISVHGGIGATWEHDAPLYFRRAQLSRRLLGGTAGATDRVAGELLSSPQAA